MLEDFLKRVVPFRGQQLEEFMQEFTVIEYPKGQILHEQGDILNVCFFVLDGCIRQYTISEDGEEQTVEFYTKEEAVVDFRSYKQQLPSEYSYVSAIDSTILIGEYDIEEAMCIKYPELEKITRSMVELSFGENQINHANFRQSSPQERYLALIETRPELLDFAAQHQLASFLGMTPESLSRIKKRLSNPS
ncbi:Crp/Fnr family transcriptional regulator [Aerococcaceae bacterium DSM 111176]|nr:Crp/Fnr family transcriptional regulator [Aerococcaceae bacterium DSM 111176]